MPGVAAQGRAVARSLLLLAAAAGAGFLLASCASVPARTPTQWMGVLPGDATLYASIRVRASEGVVRQLLASQPGAPAGPGAAELDQLLDRTERIVLSARLAAQRDPSFAAVALGSYPAGLMGCRLSGSRDWKKTRGPVGTYWQWKKTGLQVAVPGSSVLLAASTGIEALLERYRSPSPLPVPDDAALDMERRDLALFLPVLPMGIASGPGSASNAGSAVPIREVWLVGSKGPEAWSVSGTANTASERDARLVALAMRFALVAWMRGQGFPSVAEKLRTVTVAPEGSQVRLAGLSFSEEELGQVLLSLLARPRDASEPRAQAEPQGQTGQSP
jgi:hypothetical protein